jgi:predicted peptidase
MRSVSLILALGLILCCSGDDWRNTNFPERTFTLYGETFKYRIYVPKDRDPIAKIPVMLYLHGSGARGDDNREQIGILAELAHESPEKFPFAIVFPQCPMGTSWTAAQIEKALAALDKTVAEVNGDEKRLYLAGYSMGGFGAWHTAIANPSKFAAMISIAGGVEAMGVVSTDDRFLLSPQVRAAETSGDVYRAYGEALKNMPIWIIHGDKDDSVPVEQSRKLAAALKTAGAKDINYVELPNSGHDILDRTFRDEGLVEWLNQRSK